MLPVPILKMWKSRQETLAPTRQVTQAGAGGAEIPTPAFLDSGPVPRAPPTPPAAVHSLALVSAHICPPVPCCRLTARPPCPSRGPVEHSRLPGPGAQLPRLLPEGWPLALDTVPPFRAPHALGSPPDHQASAIPWGLHLLSLLGPHAHKPNSRLPTLLPSVPP